MKNYISTITLLGLMSLVSCNQAGEGQDAGSGATGEVSAQFTIHQNIEAVHFDNRTPHGAVDDLFPISNRAITASVDLKPDPVLAVSTPSGAAVTTYLPRSTTDELDISSGSDLTLLTASVPTGSLVNCSGLSSYLACQGDKLQARIAELPLNFTNVAFSLGGISYSLPVKKFTLTQETDIVPGGSDISFSSYKTAYQRSTVSIGGRIFFLNKTIGLSDLYELTNSGVRKIAVRIMDIAKHNDTLYALNYDTSELMKLNLDSNEFVKFGNLPYVDLFNFFLASYNNELYFTGRKTGTLDWRIYKLNASDSSILDVTNFLNDWQQYHETAAVFNGALYFTGLVKVGSVQNQKLFKLASDGSIKQIADLNNGYDYIKGKLTVHDNHLFFMNAPVVNNLKGSLYKIARNDSITLVSNEVLATGGFNDFMESLNGELFFPGFTSAGHRKIFKLKADGSIVQVSNIRDGADDIPQLAQSIVFDGDLYFEAMAVGGESHLFKIKGTNGKVVQVTNIDETGEYITGMTVQGNALYFAATVDSKSKIYKLQKN